MFFAKSMFLICHGFGPFEVAVDNDMPPLLAGFQGGVPGAAATGQHVAERSGLQAGYVHHRRSTARLCRQCPQPWQHGGCPRLAAGVMVDALQLIETGDKIALFQPVRFLANADQPGGMHRTP
jgi:hypothetical protein